MSDNTLEHFNNMGFKEYLSFHRGGKSSKGFISEDFRKAKEIYLSMDIRFRSSFICFDKFVSEKHLHYFKALGGCSVFDIGCGEYQVPVIFSEFCKKVGGCELKPFGQIRNAFKNRVNKFGVNKIEDKPIIVEYIKQLSIKSIKQTYLYGVKGDDLSDDLMRSYDTFIVTIGVQAQNDLIKRVLISNPGAVVISTHKVRDLLQHNMLPPEPHSTPKVFNDPELSRLHAFLKQEYIVHHCRENVVKGVGSKRVTHLVNTRDEDHVEYETQVFLSVNDMIISPIEALNLDDLTPLLAQGYIIYVTTRHYDN